MGVDKVTGTEDWSQTGREHASQGNGVWKGNRLDGENHSAMGQAAGRPGNAI